MNEKQRKEIAKFVVVYLKNRMMIKQKLISMTDNQIDFETFMTSYSKFLDIKNNLVDDSFSETVSMMEYDFVRNADCVVMTEEQIDELMGYIKESIENYGLYSKYFYNETIFVREVLEELVFKMEKTESEIKCEKLKRIEQFLSFTQIDENIGFCEAISATIYNEDKFCISSYDAKCICTINNEGINEITSNELDDEDLLIADKIYAGYLTNNENAMYIFLEKTVNGQRKMKEISETQEIYDILGEKNKNEKITTIKKAVLYDKINDFFKKLEVPFFALNSNNIYMKNSFWEIIVAFNKYRNMSLDERNEIEKIVNIATSWWVDNTSFRSVDCGICSKIAETFPSLVEILENSVHFSESEEDKIQKFKEVLGNKIRILLLSRPMFGLTNKIFDADEVLRSAIKESGVTGSFPYAYMQISEYKIEVTTDGSTSREVIYSREVNTEKSETKICRFPR